MKATQRLPKMNIIMKTSVCPMSTLLFLILVHGGSAAYCDDNLFPEDEELKRFSGVKFTKELSTTEYGSLGTFKMLHCCGKSYLSLEWFKDNRPYPWLGDMSSLILNPESANQTIYTRSLTSSDHGVYTCQLANQTHIVNHHMTLVTIENKSYWGDPLSTYQLPKEYNAQPGDSVRLYCEGFVGRVDLPDAVNRIKWKKNGGNETIKSNEKYKIEEVIRENMQVLGAYLFINKIEMTDYGQYICSISNTDDQILQQFTNITKPVFKFIQPNNKIHREFKLLFILVVLPLILIIWKRRWLCSVVYQIMKKTLVTVKAHSLSKKTVHRVIVFHDEENKDRARYLVEKMGHDDTYNIKKYHIDFNEEFVKCNTELVKGYNFALYLSSSNTMDTSFLTIKSTEIACNRDNSLTKIYIIDCSNKPVTPTKSWCDQVLMDLQSSEHKDRNMPNKLIRVV